MMKTESRPLFTLGDVLNSNITVNDCMVKPDYVFKNNDIVKNNTIRYEKPILDAKLNIVFRDDDFLAVDKPASWPCHANSNYFYNTLTKILRDEHSVLNAKILHRIDRPTSGLVVFAFNKASIAYYNDYREKLKIEKIYLCRVKGNFPEDLKETDAKIIEVGVGKFGVDNKGKDSLTRFNKLFYDETSNTSVLEAMPVTGRTHQIRVHLQYLGYPIANDPIYGGEYYNMIEGFEDDIKELEEFGELDEETKNEGRKVFFRLWLHSFKYSFGDRKFSTDVPDWSEADFKVNRVFD